MQQNLRLDNLSYSLYRRRFYPGIKLKVTKEGEVIVITSVSMSQSKIEDFLSTKRLWITKSQAKLKQCFALTHEKKQYLTSLSPYVVFVREEIYIDPKALLSSAKVILPALLDDASRGLELQYTALSFRNNTRVWGSCTTANKINLNTRLLLLPKHLLLYVLYHELAHIKHKNHSQHFWSYLEEIYPGASYYAKEMRNFWYILHLKSIPYGA